MPDGFLCYDHVYLFILSPSFIFLYRLFNIVIMFGCSPSQPEREGWQDGDIGEGSMDNYMPKQKEFITWCKNNRPGVINER